jgi:hypothetical protein
MLRNEKQRPNPATNFFGLTDVGVNANPALADIDGDFDALYWLYGN